MRLGLGILILVALSLALVGCGSKPSKASTASVQQRQELQDYWNKASPKVRKCRQIDEALTLTTRMLVTLHRDSAQSGDLRARLVQLLVLQSETVGQLSTIPPPASLAEAHGRLVTSLENGCAFMAAPVALGRPLGQEVAGMEKAAKVWASAVNHVAAELGLPQPLPTPADTATSNPRFVPNVSSP